MAEHKRFEPPTSDYTEPYWEATRKRELLLQWCVACAEPVQDQVRVRALFL